MPAVQSVRSPEDRRQPETQRAVPALSVASGEERPVRSPALELQEALEEMLNAPAVQSPRPVNAMVFGLGLLTLAGACTAFWISLGRMLISLA